MRLMPQIVCFGILLSATAMANAKPAYVASTVNLRAAPGTTSEVVAKIPAGSLIDANDCTEGWCAVTWQDKTGYAIQSAIDASGRVPGHRNVAPRVIGDEPIYGERPQIYYEPPPTVYYEPAPYYYGYYGPYYRRGWRRW